MPYVLEVLYACILDADLAQGDAQQLHQREGILVGAVGGAEARHGDAYDACAGQPEAVERAHRGQ